MEKVLEINKKYKKSLTTAKKLPEEIQVRDKFQTPNYAIDLLIPFIPKNVKRIWECAAGGRKITNRLIAHGYDTYSTDLMDEVPVNFLTWNLKDQYTYADCIITNPPFSIKDLFIEKCFEYRIPWAMLINADYSQQQIDWIERGCEKIIPKARISYITPNVLRRIHEGEVWKLVQNNYHFHDSIDELRLTASDEYDRVMNAGARFKFHSIEECPQELLYKYSSAQFHSMWLTWGFGLGKSETFVELSVEQRRTNI